MSNIYKDAPIVKIVMLKGADGDRYKLSELQNDMTFLTEEQIITLVTNIVDTGEVGDIDTGFVTRLKEQNKGKELKFWVGTQAEYNQIELAQANTFYIITDDNFKSEVMTAIAALNQRIDDISQVDVEEEVADIQTRLANAESDIDDLESTSTSYGTRITTLEGREDESRYAAGDVDTITFTVGGYYVNKSGKHYYFDIPLNKRASGLTVTVTGLSVKCAIYNTQAWGSAGAPTYGTRSFTPESYTVTQHDTYLEVDLEYADTAPTANTCMITMSGTANISIS